MPKSYRKVAEVGPQGWARTYTNISQRAVKLARRRLPIEEKNDAEDKFHDAIVRLLERGPAHEKLENPNSYALKAVQNVCIDRCNIRSRPKAENTVALDAWKNDDCELPMIELTDPGRGPEMDAEIKIDNEKLRQVLEAHSVDLTGAKQTC